MEIFFFASLAGALEKTKQGVQGRNGYPEFCWMLTYIFVMGNVIEY